MKNRRFPLFFFICVQAVLLTSGQPVKPALLLAENGRSDYRIVLAKGAPDADIRAANLLRSSIEAICGAALPIVTDEDPPAEKEILIGRSRRIEALALPSPIPFAELGDDGFVWKTVGPKLVIAGGPGKGTLYGVASFLEDQLGCRKYSQDAFIRPHRARIEIPLLDRRDVPFFATREVFMPDAFDDDYADWHGIDNQRVRQKDWGLWVHTFRTFVPPDKFFQDHPEYFTEQNGIRVPDAQLCLTNPDVFKLVVESLRTRIKEYPEPRYWSVSQNDTFSPCQCPSCRALDEKYGGPSGTLLNFVNRVAREFPDKIISTLAYQYSRQAPTGIKPEKNVNIMLCTIECNRSRPISTDPANASFVKDIRNWSRLTDNILLWDYVVQFRNYIDPFPNLRVLQPNIRFFRDCGVRLMFQQGSATSRSEFHELRTYLIAKLLWNPDADVAALTADFLKGYYGPAAPYIGDYIRLLHDSIDKTHGDLGIYGFPWDGIKTYLTPALIAKYEKLFARAEASVAASPEFAARVKFARLPLDFAVLEISKRNPTPDLSIFTQARGTLVVNPAMVRRLDAFVEKANAVGAVHLDESQTSPDAYKAEMENFFADGMKLHKGFRKLLRLAAAPSAKYQVGGAPALTDGLKGTTDYHCNWLGFENEEMEATVDLGRAETIQALGIRFLQDINAWIWMPQAVEFSVSQDGREFRPVGLVFAQSDAKKAGVVIEDFRYAIKKPLTARYVKARTKSFLKCPAWHKGAGGMAWIFTDELVIE